MIQQFDRAAFVLFVVGVVVGMLGLCMALTGVVAYGAAFDALGLLLLAAGWLCFQVGVIAGCVAVLLIVLASWAVAWNRA